MLAPAVRACPHFGGHNTAAVRCAAGRWGGYPSHGTCLYCWSGGKETPAPVQQPEEPIRSNAELEHNKAACMACDSRTIDRCAHQAGCHCVNPWDIRSYQVTCPEQKWVPPPAPAARSAEALRSPSGDTGSPKVPSVAAVASAPPPCLRCAPGRAACALELYGKLPGISCYMPTRALPARLYAEAVGCFLTQDWAGPKELVIYNNDPTVELVCSHPEVRIINEPRNGRSLGALFNATIAACRYDLLACWEDDDLRLPAHLRTMYQTLRGADAVRADRYWYSEGDEIREWSGNGPAHSGWLLRRYLLDCVGGYPDANTDCDHRLWAAFASPGHQVVTRQCTPDDTTLIYRWATGSVHLSGFGVEGDVMGQAAAMNQELQKSGRLVSGRHEIIPDLSAADEWRDKITKWRAKH